MADDAPTAGAQPRRAVRLICEVDGDDVRVVSRRRLVKVVPLSEALRRDAARGPRRCGFWIEVRDDAERVRYRRAVPDPLTGEREIPVGGGSFTRRATATDAFALLVPDLPGADHVSLIRTGRPPPAGARGSALATRTGELARLRLQDEDGGGYSGGRRGAGGREEGA